ncbi:MAG: hypothetical protein PUA64_05880 [Treponema sp.]|nr:hypothetical protein [Treponema sp.]
MFFALVPILFQNIASYDFEFTRNRLAILPDGQGETLDLNQVVDIFINSGAKFQSKKISKKLKFKISLENWFGF